ncbi:hypothetical protein QW131_24245 [Roseibium salinum]|nr:hypothetical protein [Roseibium salinum]
MPPPASPSIRTIRRKKAYLQMLAARLDLDSGLVEEIELAVREAETAG